MGGKWGYGWFLQYISPVMIRVFVQNFMAVFISFRVKSEVLNFEVWYFTGRIYCIHSYIATTV
jgi:hypothetical protein